jgi:hypothetical protein
MNNFVFHRPKFEDRKTNTVQSRAALFKKNWPPRGQANRNANKKTNRQDKRRSQEDTGDIKNALELRTRPRTDRLSGFQAKKILSFNGTVGF